MGECSSSCSSKPFVEANQQNFASKVEESQPFGETLNHPFQRAEAFRTARIRSHAQLHPPYMKQDEEFNNPYSNQIMPQKSPRSPKRDSLVKTKQVFVHIDNNMTLAAINPQDYLNSIRSQLNLTQNMRFFLEYGNYRYMIGKIFQNRFLVSQVWDKFENGKHLIIRSRKQPEQKPNEFLTLEDMQLRNSPYLGQNPKKEDLIIIRRNQFLELAILDPTITLQVARIILKLGSLEHFYQIKSDKMVIVDKKAESSFQVKDIRQKNSDRKYQIIIRMKVYDFKGGKYVGQISQGKREGYGCFYYGKGDALNREYYEGMWVNCKRHGKGTLVWKNGNKYVGGFSNDDRSGQGMLTLKDGTTIQYKQESEKDEGVMRDKIF